MNTHGKKIKKKRLPRGQWKGPTLQKAIDALEERESEAVRHLSYRLAMWKGESFRWVHRSIVEEAFSLVRHAILSRGSVVRACHAHMVRTLREQGLFCFRARALAEETVAMCVLRELASIVQQQGHNASSHSDRTRGVSVAWFVEWRRRFTRAVHASDQKSVDPVLARVFSSFVDKKKKTYDDTDSTRLRSFVAQQTRSLLPQVLDVLVSDAHRSGGPCTGDDGNRERLVSALVRQTTRMEHSLWVVDVVAMDPFLERAQGELVRTLFNVALHHEGNPLVLKMQTSTYLHWLQDRCAEYILRSIAADEFAH